MKKIGTSIVAILATAIVFANPPQVIQRTLKWGAESTVIPYEGSQPIRILRFDGAIFDEAHPSLPYYTERFKLDGYASFRAVFTSETYESFDKTPSGDDDAISNEITISANVEQDRLDYFGRITLLPIRKNGAGQYERLVSFEIRLIPTPRPAPVRYRGGNTYTSVLSDGDIYKIGVTQPGVYKLDYGFLKNSLQIPVDNIDPRTIKLYGNGGGMLPELVGAPRADDLVENAIEVVGEGDGKFDAGDYILFYGEGPDKWYLDTTTLTFKHPRNTYATKNYYFIKIGPGNGLRVQDQASLPGATYTVNSFSDFLRYEEEVFNVQHDWSIGQGSGRRWFGDSFKVKTDQDYSNKFQVDNLLPNVPIKLSALFAARIKSGSFGRYSITANGTTFTSANFATTQGGSTDSFAQYQGVSGEFSPSNGQIQLSLNFTKGNDVINEGWLDYIELNFRRALTMSGNQMIFRDIQSIGQPVSSFSLSNASGIQVWDITNPLLPQRQQGTLSGSVFSFGAPTDTLKEFIAFANNGFLTAEAVGKIENQNIHAITDIDLAIVYHKDFLSEAERLAEHRRNFSQLQVATVDIEQLYNEFSSGRKDATAIRDFAKMLFERSPSRFRSLLLFGDGSFDSRDIYKLGGDFIPVYETEESLSPIQAFPSDDFFTLLSEGEGLNIGAGSMDIGIGRLPVKDLDEARGVVDKIVEYDTKPANLRDWRNRIVFVGDDEDTNRHTGDADDIAQKIGTKNPNLNIDKVYLDAFPQVSTSGGIRAPLATEAINNNIFKGVLAMVYLGHGGPKGWSQERVLKLEDILGWKNLEKLPIIITATCSFSGYDNPAFTTAGELCLLQETGGAIALYTTVRPVYASANATLTQRAVDTLFYKFDHEIPTLGEVLRTSKNKESGTNGRKFTLIGDPSQKLALPNYQVVTTKVNGHDISASVTDTIKALQKVTIEGQVQDDFGNVLTNFNGIVYPTIYDKKVTYRTLGQATPVFDFDLQKNIIFKGRASVKEGKFKFTFVVPKDIDYRFGKSKISYYAADETQLVDGAGNYQEVVVGGTDANALADQQGPKVEVYMNDENFVFGGITHPNPVLLVKLEDDNGINVVGNSVGHDLEGILDNNTQNTYILNDFYEAALDDYTKGEVRYPLYDLPEGPHDISVRAWDIANNQTQGLTNFVVVTSEDMALSHVLNYPNPFTSSTCFMFEHNQAGIDLDVMVQIYTVSGRLIKTLEQRIISPTGRLGSDNCLQWDGRDDYGDPLAKGVYIYKVKVRSANSGDMEIKGESDFEKLVILK